MNYCTECGTRLQPHTVGGEARRHSFCTHCQTPRIAHPVIVVTTFVACARKLLWVRRAQPPQAGMWAIPGGFLEQDETLAAGAARELREEAGISLPPGKLSFYMTGTITYINQVYVAFRAQVEHTRCEPGIESLEARFFSRDECPWDEVAYPQVNDSVMRAYDDLDQGRFQVWQAEMTDQRYEFVPVALGPSAPAS